MRFPRFIIAVAVVCGGTLLMAPATILAQERIIVQPAGVLTWSKIKRINAERPAAAEAPRLIPAPMPGPGPREIGVPGLNRGKESEGKSLPEISSVSKEPRPVAPAAATLDFEALPDNNTVIPPDTHGSVGPSHVMTMLNSQVRIQSKVGATTSTVSLSSFWSALIGSKFDPKVYYDAIDSRWLAACEADGGTDTSRVCFAISSTSDPTGSWAFYEFDADPGDTVWADYPGFGFNTTWIAITSNMYTVSSGASRGAKMWVIDKSTALSGGPLTVTVFPTKFDLAGGVNGFTLQPCLTFGSEPTLYIVDNSGWASGGTFLLRLSQITGTGPLPTWSVVPGSSFSGTGLFFVATNFNFTQIDADQLGLATKINTNDPRMLNAVFRNSRVWCTHSAGLPVAPSAATRTAVFWYQLNPAAMPSPIVQSGALDGGAGVHYYFPSISANSDDDACLGFTRSDATRYAEAVFTGRLATRASGTMQPIQVLKAGISSYSKFFSGPRNRWGDFSNTCVDPSDDQTFWTIQEYAAQNVGSGVDDGRWGTWWGKIAPATVLPIQLASLSAAVVRDNDVKVSWRTVSETNNYGFEVFRRRGQTGEWKKLGFLEGHGTTLIPQSYSYVDQSVSFGKYYYSIKQIDLDGSSKTFPEIEVSVGVGPDKFLLGQNYPNPFNPTTTIDFTVPVKTSVTLKVYNVLGQEISTAFKANVDGGRVYTVPFDASGFSSGVYIYRLVAGSFVDTKKMLLMR
ncbi:MAG: T9SS type A sorting domain-containing protein [Bacteroidota bacterium]